MVSSYLGLVVVWFEDGKIHRAILEFIRYIKSFENHFIEEIINWLYRLKKKHDGQYLAEVVGDCMKRWGLKDNVFDFICSFIFFF